MRGLGYRVAIETTKSALLTRLRGTEPPDVLLIGMPDGAELAGAAVRMGGRRPVLVGALAGRVEEGTKVAGDLGLDLFVTRPHSPDSLAIALHAAVELGATRQRLRTMHGTEELLRERLHRYGEADATTGFQHFDFFKQLLVRELKRAKRYSYPIAVCVVALDPWRDREPATDTQRKLRTRVASAIAGCIRDIDLPVDYSDDRFLLLLPYTDGPGAEQVGRRVAGAVRDCGALWEGAREFRISVSVGVAAQTPKRGISFAKLIRDATAAVRAAQLKGGGRVILRR